MANQKIKVGDVFPTNQGQDCTVLQYGGWDKVLIEFNDKHKHQMLVRSEHLRRGSVKNPYFPLYSGVGYIGVGSFKTGSACHKTWSSMITRCYAERRILKNKSYQDCTVHEDWHNYQNFALWYENQEFKGEGYQLDKDLLKKGNSEYSADSCCLVPAEINALFIGCKKQNALPIGVSVRKSNGKFKASICLNNKPTAIGEYATAEEASQAYKAAKTSHVKTIAEKWRNKITNEAYQAIIGWVQ